MLHKSSLNIETNGYIENCLMYLLTHNILHFIHDLVTKDVGFYKDLDEDMDTNQI